MGAVDTGLSAAGAWLGKSRQMGGDGQSWNTRLSAAGAWLGKSQQVRGESQSIIMENTGLWA